jgi:hypothetical protein
MAAEVSWENIAKAISYFKDSGYTYVEVPWVVPDEFTRSTCPEERWIVNSTLGDLVGSAEQSFLYLDATGKLPKGKFVSCTPCFRNEDTIDLLHQTTFMKVELYMNEKTKVSDLPSFVEEMSKFYEGMGVFEHLVVRELPDGTVDLELGGIEIGSYGVIWRHPLDVWHRSGRTPLLNCRQTGKISWPKGQKHTSEIDSQGIYH